MSRFARSRVCAAITGLMVARCLTFGAQPTNSITYSMTLEAGATNATPPVSVCECELPKQNGCAVQIIAGVAIVAVGAFLVWQIIKLCKKVLPPDPPPPPPPPPDTNTNAPASIFAQPQAQAAMAQTAVPLDRLAQDGEGIAAWDVSGLGYFDPVTGVLFSRCYNYTFQSSTNLADWHDEYSVVGWQSMDASTTNTLMVWYSGHVGYDTNHAWQDGTPIFTNYCVNPQPGTPTAAPPITLPGGPKRFFRLMSSQ